MDAFFPLSLAPKTLKDLLLKLETESELKQQIAFQTQLGKFLQKVDQRLDSEMDDITTLMATLNDVAEQYSHIAPEHIELDISDRELGQLQYQINDAALSSKSRFTEAKERLISVEEQIEKLSVNIARAPDQERLNDQIKVIKDLNSKLTNKLLD